MTELTALSIDTPHLTASVTIEDAKLVLVLAGTADSRSMADLDALVVKLHEGALRHGAGEVIVDIRRLKFMNSSCFKTLVDWLGNLEEVEAARQYKLCIRSSEEHHWQKRSLAALSCLAVDLVRIQTHA
jgi:hypothetical protein